MTAPRRAPAASSGFAVLGALLVPAAAIAHGLGLEASTKSLPEFVPLGMEHMALGWDHLLFIIGVVVLAGEARRAVKVISIFALGHSTTLIVATLAGWQLNPTVVDVLIALSLVYVGALAQLGRPKEWRPVFLTVFAFGLVHGLGLSTRLQELNIQDGLFGKTIAFNVGVELGQLAVIGVVVGVGTAVLRAYRGARNPNAIRYGGALLMAIGFVAAVVISIPDGADDDDGTRAGATTVAAPPAKACTERKVDPPTFSGGGHPALRFQPPDADVDDVDIVHVLTDGFVALRYKPTIPAAQASALERYVLKDDRPIVGAPAAQEVPLKAVTAYRELSCTRIDVAALEEFTARWLADVQAGRATE